MRTSIMMVVLVWATVVLRAAPDSTSGSPYVIAPNPLSSFTGNLSLGTSLTMLPQPLVEAEVPLPSVDIRWRLGLPLNVGLTGRFSSNLASTIVTAGPMFSVEWNRVTLGGGYKVGYFYGTVTFIDGFDTDVTGWLNYPFVTAGIRFNEFTISGVAEVELVLAQRLRVETIRIDKTGRTFNGASLTLAIEQPFWKETHIALGVTLHYSRNPYQAWLAFDTFDDILFYPELFAGFML